jgi:UDP-N-acetylglucosamine 2-epimerase (non-hydrolysing)
VRQRAKEEQMKIVTVLGTRPEIIRLSRVIQRLDGFCEHILVHTGQNFVPSLSDKLFVELGLRQPDVHLNIRSESFSDQVGQILSRVGETLREVRPNGVLFLGDTNSALSALVAARMGIPTFHLEAGNRCFDDRVPEEINRRVIDHCSSILMPYTQRSKENLVREGIQRQRIFVVGNPILEVLEAHGPTIDASTILSDMSLQPKDYFLATLHRAENVDEPGRLKGLLDGLDLVSTTFGHQVVVSVHPRTADKIRQSGLSVCAERVRLIEPLGFFDFVKLEKQARAVMTDSGTVQEECCIFGIPNVTVRDVTERAETQECGSNILSGGDSDSILQATKVALALTAPWVPPVEYMEREVSSTVAKIILGYHRPST